ncbi:18729_t:CDS:2 [Funneliformis geosporum]|uniref:18729_t:CDS:1 n=1 Tax=Funneliformis geosporum TaxID=1117311 RepID=A0A9W4SJR5_9GLOM|nr:18729_t:CDS:2 [Funneliformis geosporum]
MSEELVNIFNILLGISMVIGPVLGYFDQIKKFRETKSSSGYSLDTTGILLVSSIIRVYFWIGKKFDTVLLYQSLLMISVQLVLLYECLRFRYPIIPTSNRRWFWNWYTYKSYLIFLIVLVGMLGILQLIFYEQEWFTETLGYLSLGIESTVPMPQAYQNFKRHSVSGFSKWIILTWVGGDSFKTFYYIYTNAPLQFILCGIVQLSVDFVVVFQTVIYGRKMREIFGLNDTRWYNNRPSSYSSLDNI